MKFRSVKIIIFLLFVVLASCNKEYRFYDIEGPLFEFYKFTGDKILFQFNEPVSWIIFLVKGEEIEKVINVINDFPVANIYIPSEFFYGTKKKTLQIEAIDVFGNYYSSEINAPVFNKYPALLQIDEVRLRYSKDKKQKIILTAIKPGSTVGFNLHLYFRGKELRIPFLFENVLKGEKLYIQIDRSKEYVEQNYEIGFSKNFIKIILKNRLSQISSLIFISDNNGEILDNLLYFNSKKHPYDYYSKNKTFRDLEYELTSRNEDLCPFDINGTTTKRTIKKIGKKYIIKNN